MCAVTRKLGWLPCDPRGQPGVLNFSSGEAGLGYALSWELPKLSRSSRRTKEPTAGFHLLRSSVQPQGLNISGAYEDPYQLAPNPAPGRAVSGRTLKTASASGMARKLQSEVSFS